MHISKEILNDINNKLAKDVEFLENRKISTLDVGKIYIIKQMTSMNARFGRAIVVVLHDTRENVTFQSFLPKRAVETVSDEIVQIMNDSDGKYTLTYLGQGTRVFSGNNTKTLLNFGYLE